MTAESFSKNIYSEKNRVNDQIETQLKDTNEDLANLKSLVLQDGLKAEIKQEDEEESSFIEITDNHAISILKNSITDKNTWKEIYSSNSAGIIFAIQKLIWGEYNQELGNIDGLLGNKTKIAVTKFQENRNKKNPTDQINVDGLPGIETIKRILLSKGVEVPIEKQNKLNIEETISLLDTKIVEQDEIVKSKRKKYNETQDKSRENFENFKNNFLDSLVKFRKLLNHKDFNFNGMGFRNLKKGGSIKVERQYRESVLDYIKTKFETKKCLLPTGEEFNKFVEYVGKKNIEDYPKTKDNFEKKVLEYLETKESDYKSTSWDIINSEGDLSGFKESVRLGQAFRILKEYLEVGDFSKELEFGSENFHKDILDYIPSIVEKNVKKLNLYGKDIEQINLNRFTNLTSLDLRNNILTSLDGIQNLTNLTSLALKNNGLTSLDGIQNLTNLTSLDLGNNMLTSLDGIQNLTNLTSLDLKNNGLISLDGIQNLTNLTSLDLGVNGLTSLSGIQSLTNLKKLIIYNNKINDINPLKDLKDLDDLDLGGNPIISLEDIKNLTNLTKLDIRHLDENFGDFSPLKELTKLEVIDIKDVAVEELIKDYLPTNCEIVKR